jgi:hypothetical protein
MSQLSDWGNQWAVSDEAMGALYKLMGLTPDTPVELHGKNEAYVQSVIRLAAPMQGYLLGRNNVGALKDERGIPVRYGWLNDTAQLNKTLKTGDLLGYQSGWYRDYETLEPVKVAVFAMPECKRAGWVFNPKDQHEIAQLRAINMVQAAGGIAGFTTGVMPTGVRFPALDDKAPKL